MLMIYYLSSRIRKFFITGIERKIFAKESLKEMLKEIFFF